MEIAIIGSDDFVTGFRLSGANRIFVSEKDMNEKIDLALKHENIGVLVFDEQQFNDLDYKTKKMLDKIVTPVVVTVSDTGKDSDLRHMIKKSIGVDLWK